MKLLTKQLTCFAGMEMVAQSVHINYFFLFYPGQTLNFLCYPYTTKFGCYWAGYTACLSPLCSASLRPNSEAKSWGSFSSV